MDVLIYNELNFYRVKKQYEKVLTMIRRDDFFSAEVKKLSGTPYYRAKLDYENRLLFKVITYNQKKYALMLEIILNHEYDKSRFLNGVVVDESKLEIIQNNYFEQQPLESVVYINHDDPHFHILDKIISFDDIQRDIFNVNPPLIIIGSAGSGKTMLTLEKMKPCLGSVLYVTGSPYLVQNAQQLYHANHYLNEDQEIDFLSYRELLETIKVPEGKEIDFQAFSRWALSVNRSRSFLDSNKLYEEFKGVITGNAVDKPYISRAEYLGLGVKQTIYTIEERAQVYDLFERYLSFLKSNQRYDANLISFDYLSRVNAKYDFIIVDEVQDFTAIQLFLILKTLKCQQQFILCGDSNQIIHPNFFSWSKIKSLFYKQSSDSTSEVIRVLNKNYRNSIAVTVLANKVLKAKNARFGSIDKESHYLVESQSEEQGEIYCVLENDTVRKEINSKTCASTRFAVIVLRDDLKAEASQYFQTPLVFSVYEAKGLEYENVILYNLISSDEKKFRDIADGVNQADLEGDLVYGRVKDKADRSLEIYKFFINAFYVAITRAMKKVYFVERLEKHPFLSLLSLNPTREFISIESQKSSLDDWQKEARRLELQGKREQADAIRSKILHNEKVPWSVMTPDYLSVLYEKAINKDKSARLSLFEYAMYYNQFKIFDFLGDLEFAPALKPKKDYDLLNRKYFMSYVSTNTASVLRQVALYGVDFRNVFNQTPLMVACHFGNTLLVKQLTDKGADTNLTDNLGRNAFQVTLQRALLEPRFAKDKMESVCGHLALNSLSIQSEGRLIKLDVRSMEFFLLNVIILLLRHKQLEPPKVCAFSVDSFTEPFKSLPENILLERRKKRSYISSILSKNEKNKDSPYTRKFLLRVKRGYYILNPDLMIKVGDDWINANKLTQGLSLEMPATC